MTWINMFHDKGIKTCTVKNYSPIKITYFL